MDSKTPIIPVQLPANVAETVQYAMGCGWWPFNEKTDIGFFLDVWKATKGKVNLFEVFIDLETWRLDNPTPMGKRENVRSRYRRFCTNKLKWMEPQNQAATAAQIERKKPRPPMAGAARDFTKSITDMMAEAVGLKSCTFPPPVMGSNPLPKATGYQPLTPEQAQGRRAELARQYRELKEKEKNG